MNKIAKYPETEKMGIRIVNVNNQPEAINICKDILYNKLAESCVLFLSGGSTPKSLYEILAKEKKLRVGAVALVDERFGKKMHDSSNEKMIKKTGLIGFLKKQKIPFYSILENKSISKTSKVYEKQVLKLFKKYKNKVAILGIGADGHTAGIPAIPKISKKIILDKTSQVAFYNDDEKYGKRITITFNALENFDSLIVLVFGKEKKKALELMFIRGLIEQIPARFLVKEQIAKKVILITDQKI